jgi:hypothetical protein
MGKGGANDSQYFVTVQLVASERRCSLGTDQLNCVRHNYNDDIATYSVTVWPSSIRYDLECPALFRG